MFPANGAENGVETPAKAPRKVFLTGKIHGATVVTFFLSNAKRYRAFTNRVKRGKGRGGNVTAEERLSVGVSSNAFL